MHFLAAQQVGIDDAGQARDLQQDPADILVFSAADSELAVLARAYAEMTKKKFLPKKFLPRQFLPSLRLVPLRDLHHPASLDLYIDKTLSRSHLVIARLLGGQSYFPYFCEQVEQTCRANNIPLALLAGEGQEDRTLTRRSSVPETQARALHRCLAHGGMANAKTFLLIAKELLDDNKKAEDTQQRKKQSRNKTDSKIQMLPEAGLYLPNNLPKANLRAKRKPHTKAMLLFYRALVQAEDTEPIDALIAACALEGVDLVTLYVSSLKSEPSLEFLHQQIAEHKPRLFLNATGFALGTGKDPLACYDCPVLQIALASQERKAWEDGTRGLSPTDLAMQVVLTEMDGRIFTRAIAFKERTTRDAQTQFAPSALRPVPDRCAFVARQAAKWLRLHSLENSAKRLTIVLHNYPARDGRIANGVGLDTPRALQTILLRLRDEGYDLGDASSADLTAERLLARLKAGPTNAQPQRGQSRARLCLSDYEKFFQELSPSLQSATKRLWGEAHEDPFVRNNDGRAQGFFALPTLLLGKVAVVLQPSRGYERDANAIAHDPNLPPPHAYLAQYLWSQRVWQSCALVHVGKHGTAEWLPGKAVALSRECSCESVLSDVPHFYPFIVSDPGEGTQAKRRGSAVVIDHLSPPLARAELYGDSAALERLLDEYSEARVLHPRRAHLLAREIAELGKRSGLLAECSLDHEEEPDLARLEEWDEATRDALLARLDGHLCDLKELQIRGGLHRFGEQQPADKRAESLCALLRLPRGEKACDESLLRAIAKDCDLTFDPLDSELYGVAWKNPCPQALTAYATKKPRCQGDIVALLESYALALIKGKSILPDQESKESSDESQQWQEWQEWNTTRAVMEHARTFLAPLFDSCAALETSGLLRGLSGLRVAPGPSGAPSRARWDVLPTGRNFFSVDVRAVPSPSAWQLGWRSASLLVERYCEEHGRYPRRIALSAWGTACMRTGGEDLAQMLALMGVRPLWQAGSGRVDSFEILPLDILGRPRVDVTLRVSGFFRDAFPRLLLLLEAATHAVAALSESEEENPLAALVKREQKKWGDAAFHRIFGSAPGSYGTGLNVPIDSGQWQSETELAQTYLHHSAYAYAGEGATRQRAALERRLENLDAIVHNQDNREHDLLDSDDYYQFEGGLAVAAKTLSKSGKAPVIYHNDHSRPFSPRILRLEQELARVVRARAANPKWIAAMRQHGYKGASEIAATLDYLFAFAATTGLVQQRHFDALFDAYLLDRETRDFLARVNPDALQETAARFQEARKRNLWITRRNDVPQILEELLAETGA